MKYLLACTFLFFCTCFSTKTWANPGDTTVVISSPLLNADNSVSFDSLFVFPTNKTYRKIYLVYTLNSHNCPPNSTYCHQWDYIGGVTLKPPHGDTVELSRIISPFATSGFSRFPQPPNWSEDYIFDVTDFAPYFNDTLTINSQLGVGSPGYGITTKFIFIEGTPDRNTVGVKRTYSHGGSYGNASNPIDNNFPVLNETAPAGTVSAAFRFLVTGHGQSNDDNCCEFAEHYYKLYLNGNSILQQNIWRTCGTTELYPQGGTWPIDRANWCPGASVLPYYDSLPGITAGANYTVNVSFEPYSVPNPAGNYDASACIVYYGGINKTLDASIEDIIAPTSSQQHFRENPSSTPTLHVHNSGSTPISSIAFQYGVVDSPMQQYTWNGTLPALADTTIYLPISASLTNMSALSQSGTHSFIANITSVNGQTDQDQTNDTIRSQFIVAPNWPDTLIIKMLTSNLSANGNLNASPADANWYITNENGDTVLSRTNTDYSTLYADTVSLPYRGFYKFTINASQCTGLHWWFYDQVLTGYAPGYLQIKKPNGITNLAMHGYTYATNTSANGLKNGGEHDDFGCEYSQYFYVSDAANVGVATVPRELNVSVFPIPANTEMSVGFDGLSSEKISVSLINMLGQAVYTSNVTTNQLLINTSSFAPGIYTLICHGDDGSKKVEKVEIQH